MNPTFISLESIQIASPCHADWNAMRPVQGQDCARFCQSCGKNVYNLSGMTREEAELLVGESNLCVRLRRRSDGTVLTSDCPLGQAASLKQFNRCIQFTVVAIGFVTALLGLRGALAPREPEQIWMGSVNSVQTTPPISFPANATKLRQSGH